MLLMMAAPFNDCCLLLNLVFHDFFPLATNGLVELQGRHGVFLGGMGLTGCLNVTVQLLLHQLAQFARPQHAIIEAHLHEGFVFGRVSRLLPRMMNTQGMQIVLERVANENFVPQQLLHLSTARIQIQGMFQVLMGNAGNECPIVCHGLAGLYKLVIDGIAVPVNNGNAGQGRMMSLTSNANHLAIQSTVEVLLFCRHHSFIKAILLCTVVLVVPTVALVITATAHRTFEFFR